MSDRQSNRERLEELLADRSLFGLSADEHAELEQLAVDSDVDLESFDRTAAIASIALAPRSTEALPEHLRQKILASFSARSLNSGVAMAEAANKTSQASVDSTSATTSPRKMSRREMTAWLIAAASVAGMVIDRRTFQSIVGRGSSPADERDTLLRSAPDVIEAVWHATEDPSARDAAGDVVWSSKLQQGFLRIKGLAPNEPFVHQYQLWIFDAKRDQRYPIDGGTFNLETKGAVTVVPMRPHLPVDEPTMFAVTIEKRGGVVVSTRNRLLLVAEIAAKQA